LLMRSDPAETLAEVLAGKNTADSRSNFSIMRFDN